MIGGCMRPKPGLDTWQDDYEAKYVKTHAELRKAVATDRQLRIDAAVREGYRRRYVDDLKMRPETFEATRRTFMRQDLRHGSPTPNVLLAIKAAFKEMSNAPKK